MYKPNIQYSYFDITHQYIPLKSIVNVEYTDIHKYE